MVEITDDEIQELDTKAKAYTEAANKLREAKAAQEKAEDADGSSIAYF